MQASGLPFAALSPQIAQLAQQNARSNRRTALLGGAILTILALGFAGYMIDFTASSGRPMRSEEVMPMVLALGVAGLGAWWLRSGLRPDGFLHAMTRAGVDVCWLYVRKFSVRSGTSVALVFGLTDGQRVNIHVGRAGTPADIPALEQRGELLLREALRSFSGAVVGFSPERETAFARDPRSLH